MPTSTNIVIDNNNENKDIEENFYEANCVINNAGIWADFKDVSKEELLQRTVWRNNRLVTLEEANILFDSSGKPITPISTGKKGRGLLGKYGPNHACDPIITRFNPYKLRIEFISVKRNDTNEWAIPGGMVDPGEKVTQTLKREFTEEAVSNSDKKIIDQIFESNETILYCGPTYGDPRTTDCAWIETYVANYHISHDLWSKIKLTNQPDENTDVAWISCNSKDLYGDHSYFVKLAKKNAIKIICKKLLTLVAVIEVFIMIVIMYNIQYYKNNDTIMYNKYNDTDMYYNYEL